MSDKNIDKDIETTKELIEYSQNMINDMEYERPVEITIDKKDIQAIENVLSELEKKKEHNLTLMKEIGKRDKKIEEIEKTKSKLGYELMIRDKMIDLMAKQIDNYDAQLNISYFKRKEYIIEHFRNEVLKDE